MKVQTGRTCAWAVTACLIAGTGLTVPLRARADVVQYTVTTKVTSITIPETKNGNGAEVAFTITNKTSIFETYAGQGFTVIPSPVCFLIACDPTDDFDATVIAPPVPSPIDPKSSLTVKVLLTPPKEDDDPTDKVGGQWILTFSPSVKLGFGPGSLPPADGMPSAASIFVHITDTPEPSLLVPLGVLVLIGLCASQRRKTLYNRICFVFLLPPWRQRPYWPKAPSV